MIIIRIHSFRILFGKVAFLLFHLLLLIGLAFGNETTTSTTSTTTSTTTTTNGHHPIPIHINSIDNIDCVITQAHPYIGIYEYDDATNTHTTPTILTTTPPTTTTTKKKKQWFFCIEEHYPRTFLRIHGDEELSQLLYENGYAATTTSTGTTGTTTSTRMTATSNNLHLSLPRNMIQHHGVDDDIDDDTDTDTDTGGTFDSFLDLTNVDMSFIKVFEDSRIGNGSNISSGSDSSGSGYYTRSDDDYDDEYSDDEYNDDYNDDDYNDDDYNEDGDDFDTDRFFGTYKVLIIRVEDNTGSNNVNQSEEKLHNDFFQDENNLVRANHSYIHTYIQLTTPCR
jgi:hypothetical protein